MKKNRTRFISPAVSLLVLWSVCLVSPRPAEAQAVFTIKATGGFAYLAGGDWASGLEGQLDLMTAFGAAMGYAAQGEFKPVHSAWEAGGDIIFSMSPVLSVSAGIGYIESAGSQTDIILSQAGWDSVTLSQTPRVTAIPIRAGLVFSIPLGGRMNLMVQAGGAYYLAKIRSVYRQAEGASWNQSEVEAKGEGFGFQGGLGLEVVLTSNISLVLEGTGRYARLKPFTGTETSSGSGGWTDSEEGTLYYFQAALFPLGTYPLLTISNTAPSGSGISDVREAEVDLSGVTAQAGFLIKF